MAIPEAHGGMLGLPAGFRFMPTDEELTVSYLHKKALSFPLPSHIIPIADLAHIHPAYLPGTRGQVLFSQPVPRCGRRARGMPPGAAGVWKASGKEELVRHNHWDMQEYRLHPAMLAAAAKVGKAVEDWVVCYVFKKATRRGRNPADIGGPSSPASSCVTKELGDNEEEKMASSDKPRIF
ncbi:hypothetical protein BRADI_4g22195v3 [Brachypodium distachyon]|uniref:NAC domain-containing protein n=1 Tax=Brachypodium distachyon TaxID=15368 RepID=A0A0Q3L8Q5_BRADI|nr:hypothetical protein BRADI_4g22195v3 [Brachypodium distachyon]